VEERVKTAARRREKPWLDAAWARLGRAPEASWNEPSSAPCALPQNSTRCRPSWTRRPPSRADCFCLYTVTFSISNKLENCPQSNDYVVILFVHKYCQFFTHELNTYISVLKIHSKTPFKPMEAKKNPNLPFPLGDVDPI